jgi:hypothetical protein
VIITDIDREWIEYMGANARANREYRLHPATVGLAVCRRCGRTTNRLYCNRKDCAG